MGEVTIDSIQIEIESSSTNAAKGIDALAGSLERLKKSGSFKTVSTNLNNLSAALRNLPNVHNAANSLRTLANSIEKLKGVGTVSSLSNSLAKLPVALKSVASINLDSVAPQLQKLSDAVYPLTQIKNSGFSSMVNSMAKLETVTKSLNPEVIKAFADKVKELNDVVEPFATKMGTIKSAISGMNAQLKQTNVTLQQTNEKVNVSVFNISNLINVFSTVSQTIQQVVAFFGDVIHQASQWDGVKYQFGNSFGEQADIYYDKITQITDALYINKQAFMENSAMAASMLIGFGVDKKDAREMGLGYTQLAYDIWAAFNNVYESLDGADGAMAAVRSAIAGEVEPIRRAGFTIVEATLEQTAANHGLNISLANATEAQKSYLRYLELVDQAQRKGVVGTYAREMETAEGMMRMFRQQLKSLTQAFGSLFIPILVKVMPYVQAFVELLKEGVFWIAGIFGIEIQDIGDTWNDFSSGVGSGAGALDGVADSAGGATGALNDATKAAKELKNATLGIDELNVISPNTSSSGAGGSGSGGAGGGAGSGFEGLDISSLWDQAIFDGIKTDVDEIKEKIKGWLPVIATVSTAIAGLRLIQLLGDLEKIKNLKLVSFFTDTGKGIMEFVKAAKQMAPEVGWLTALFPKISTALSGLGGVLAGISAPVWVGIAAAVVAVGSAIYFIVENFDELKQAVKDFFAENIAPKFEEIGKSFGKIKEALGPVYDALVVAFGWIKDVAIPGVGKAFEGLGGIIVGVVGGVIGGAINGIVSFIEGFVQVISGWVQQIRGFFDIIAGIFTGDGDKIREGAQKIKDGVVDSFKGMYDASIGVVVEFVKGAIDWFTKMWDILVGHSIVPDTINAIVKWFTSLPSKIFGSIEKFATGIVDKFKGMWSKLVSWWNGKTKLKEYTPSIGSIYDKLKSRWDSARTWWNEKKSAMKTYTPSIGSIYEKVYDRWKNARDWWNGKKGSFKTYTPSIGSITDKVKSAWNSAKSWWSKNVGGLSTKLNISVPKLTVNWGEVSALGKTFKYPKSFSVKFAADGGMFDAGSLIWAGERGAEIVANAAGGKTGVMNVQQMQDAVYEGVYAAMVAATRGNSSGSGSQVIKVYLDGKEITSTVEKTQRERGASIMGNEVYSY